MKRFFSILFIFGLFFVIVSHINAEDTERVNGENKKVYTITLKTMEAGYAIKDLEELDFKGMKFIKGIDVDPRSWTVDKIIYVPKEEIITIIEFDSLDDYKERLKKYFDKQMN